MNNFTTHNKRHIADLKQKLPLPRLMAKLGMQRYAKPSAPSPFRSDTNPSWGIFKAGNGYYFKDLATGESGDELTFLAMLNKLDLKTDFPKVLEIYENLSMATDIATPVAFNKEETVVEVPVTKTPPDMSGYVLGTDEELQLLRSLRGFSMESLGLASERGFLVFGRFNGQTVYGLKDQSGHVLELRRLDGQLFDAYGSLPARKSHAVKGSSKNWPVGIMEAQAFPNVLLVEGIPDFLAAFDFMVRGRKADEMAPVAMLSASCNLPANSLHMFQAKRIRMYPHADDVGIKAAVRWYAQLKPIEGTQIDFLGLDQGYGVKDLCELNLKLDGQKAAKEVLP